MNFEVSVGIFTLNPNPRHFVQVAAGLKSQSLPLHLWEIVIVDNDSTIPIEERFKNEFSWHPNVRFIREERKGYIYAQSTAFNNCSANLIVVLGDDCVPNPQYLEKAVSIFNLYPALAVLFGNIISVVEKPSDELNSLPKKEKYRENWINQFYLQSKDEKKWTPAIRGSAGVVIKKVIATKYIERLVYYEKLNELLLKHKLPSLRGTDLDLPMIALKNDYAIGREPDMVVDHLMSYQEIRQISFAKKMFFQAFCDELFRNRWGWSSPEKISFLFWVRILYKFMNFNLNIRSFWLNIAMTIGKQKAYKFITSGVLNELESKQ